LDAAKRFLDAAANIFVFFSLNRKFALTLQRKKQKNELMMKKILIPVFALTLLAACQEKIEERAARDAKETTERKCPMPLGNEGNIILERIDFDIPTRTWKESLLLDYPEEGAELDNKELKDVLVSELKNTPSYKPYMDNGFNFQYVYCRMSNPKDTLINITLTTKDYR
jgi:hypothetical protein